MNWPKTVAAAVCILALAVAALALTLSQFHAYWCLVVLWSGGWLIVLLRSRQPLSERSRRRIDCATAEPHEDPTPPARPDRPPLDFPGPRGA